MRTTQRFRLAFSCASAAALTYSTGSALGVPPRPPTKVVQLASSVQTANRPTVVLVHGLDSSKETWTGVISELAACGYPAVALDLRGHGESPLGDAADFSATALASDVLHAVRVAGIHKCVLVGHSMGGRVAMRAAALEAEAAALAGGSEPVLRAVVVEDMDVSERSWDASLTSEERARLAGWDDAAGGHGRQFATWDAGRAALLPWYGNDEARVDSWRGKRVRPLPADAGQDDNGSGASWWSDINPLARRLAWQHVLATSDGAEAWDDLAARAASSALPFAVALWYADRPGSVVSSAALCCSNTSPDPGGSPRLFRVLYRFDLATLPNSNSG